VHSMVPMQANHNQRAMEVMEKLEMIENVRDLSGLLKFIPTSEYEPMLQAFKHTPPVFGGEGVLSQTSWKLFARLWCAQNVQYTSRYCLGRYLTKYLGEVDKNNKVLVTASSNKDEPDKLNVDFEALQNTKITSVKINERKKEEKNVKEKKLPQGRALGVPELLMHGLRYPSVIHNLKFVKVATGCMAEIAVFVMNGNGRKPRDRDESDLCPQQVARAEIEGLPVWRELDEFQLMTYTDAVFQPYSIDSVTIFSLRPPELSFVRHQSKYRKWFVRDTQKFDNQVKEKVGSEADRLLPLLSIQYARCYWVDLLGYRVYIRRDAVKQVLLYMHSIYGSIDNEYDEEDFGLDYTEVCRFFEELQLSIEDWHIDAEHTIEGAR
jgi:hypothetical protein